MANVAESWTANDAGTEYTFKLHDGIKCTDGSPLDANDVKYTIDRAFDATNPSVTKSSWGPISKAEVVDPLTVKLTLDTPFVALVPFLADSFSSIICDSNKDAAGFGTTAAIGSGPWKFVSWTKGDKIVLAKNPDYKNFGKLAENKGAPYEDGLVISVVPEPQARLAALKTGEADIAEPPPDDVADLKKTASSTSSSPRTPGRTCSGNSPSTARRSMTRAPASRSATPPTRASAINLVYGDLSLPEACPVSRGVFGNDQDFCNKYRSNYDPEKARRCSRNWATARTSRSRPTCWSGPVAIARSSAKFSRPSSPKSASRPTSR